MDNRAAAVLKTLLYSDIFGYPLEKEEIWEYLITDKKTPRSAVFSRLGKLRTKKIIDAKEGYYFLKGRGINVSRRIERKTISRLKMSAARKIIGRLASIPFVKFIGISGTLSMGNSDINDDIDIFVITGKRSVWTARFFLILALSAMGVYRKRNSRDFKDKICLNLILDEDNLHFVDNNIYVAHEIVQLVPVIDKDGTFRKFIDANRWVRDFIPNAFGKKRVYAKVRTGLYTGLLILSARILMLENMLRFLEFRYMRKHITKEEIREGFLSFHPFDYKGLVIKSYQKRLRNFGLK